MGLDLPPITKLTETLRGRGMAISETILSVEDAAEEIADFLNKRRIQTND